MIGEDVSEFIQKHFYSLSDIATLIHSHQTTFPSFIFSFQSNKSQLRPFFFGDIPFFQNQHASRQYAQIPALKCFTSLSCLYPLI